MSMTQGCPNQGADHRLFGKIGCRIQAALSVKEGGPRFKRLEFWRLAVVIAYPPYLAIGFRWGRWAFCRIGWRYDRFWAGYIFPCLTLKLKQPEFVNF